MTDGGGCPLLAGLAKLPLRLQVFPGRNGHPQPTMR